MNNNLLTFQRFHWPNILWKCYFKLMSCAILKGAFGLKCLFMFTYSNELWRGFWGQVPVLREVAQQGDFRSDSLNRHLSKGPKGPNQSKASLVLYQKQEGAVHFAGTPPHTLNQMTSWEKDTRLENQRYPKSVSKIPGLPVNLSWSLNLFYCLPLV